MIRGRVSIWREVVNKFFCVISRILSIAALDSMLKMLN